MTTDLRAHFSGSNLGFSEAFSGRILPGASQVSPEEPDDLTATQSGSESAFGKESEFGGW